MTELSHGREGKVLRVFSSENSLPGMTKNGGAEMRSQDDEKISGNDS